MGRCRYTAVPFNVIVQAASAGQGLLGSTRESDAMRLRDCCFYVISPLRYVMVWVVTCLLITYVSGCAPSSHVIASSEPPGTSIVSFPNTVDRNWTTVVSSRPSVQVAGIDGRVLSIDAFNGAQDAATELTVDLDGNLGIRGALFARSSRGEKKDILPYRGDAMGLINRVDMVSYRYRNESSAVEPHIGFIAEDAPSEFVGPGKKSFYINNSVAITMAATQQLNQRVRKLEKEVEELRTDLAKERRER